MGLKFDMVFINCNIKYYVFQLTHTVTHKYVDITNFTLLL